MQNTSRISDFLIKYYVLIFLLTVLRGKSVDAVNLAISTNPTADLTTMKSIRLNRTDKITCNNIGNVGRDGIYFFIFFSVLLCVTFARLLK